MADAFKTEGRQSSITVKNAIYVSRLEAKPVKRFVIGEMTEMYPIPRIETGIVARVVEILCAIAKVMALVHLPGTYIFEIKFRDISSKIGQM